MDNLTGEILSAALVGFGVTAFLGYMYRRAETADDNRSLDYGPELKVMGWLVALLASGCIAGVFLVSSGADKLALVLLGGLFGSLGIGLLLMVYSTAGGFDDEEIWMSYWWREPRRARWADLQCARFRKMGQYFELVFEDGTKIEFSKVLRGNRSICDHVRSLGVQIDGLGDESPTR